MVRIPIGRKHFATATVQLAVPAGKRAFALEVNEKTGVGSLVFPGDWIDVILTFGVNGQAPYPASQFAPIPVGTIPNPNNPAPTTFQSRNFE